MSLKKRSCIIFLLLCICCANAQQLQFDNIGDKLGLPSHECYNVMQDSKGYIWISTDAGLCKYNGTSSQIFDKKNGLPENSCYAVQEDKNGTIWILTAKNHILTYSNTSLREARFSKNYSDKLFSSLCQSYVLDFKNDSILIGTQATTYIAGVNSNSASEIIPDTCSYYFLKTGNNLINIKSTPNRNLAASLAAKDLIKILINTGQLKKQISIPSKNRENPSWRVLTASNKKGESFIAIGTLLIKLNADMSYSYYDMPNDIFSIYSDKHDGLWIGMSKSGVYYYADTHHMENKMINLSGYSVTGICLDAEEGVWCTTLEKSVFYCRNKNCVNYNNNKDLDKQVDLLKYENGKIFTSTGNNDLIELVEDGIVSHHINLTGYYQISDLIKNTNGWFIGGKNFIVKTNENYSDLEYVRDTPSKRLSGVSQFSVSSSKRIFAIHYGRLAEIQGSDAFDKKNPLESAGRCLQCIDNNILLYGCKDGLYKMFLQKTTIKDTCRTQKISGIDGGVVKIIETSSHKIWIATKENGLFELKGDSVIDLTKKINLPTERLYDMAEDKFGNVWLGSYLGLIKISIEGEKYSCSIYNSLNGLLSNEIFNVAADNNYIYISTIAGINRIPLNVELTNVSAPSVFINTVKVNNNIVSQKGPFIFNYNSNSLKIDVDALTFKETNMPALYYELKGLNKNTYKAETIKGNSISLDNLPPNNYELIIYALTNDGMRSAKPAQIYFEIQKPFWLKAWFIIACIICFGLAVYIFVVQIIKRIRKKEEEKTKINSQLAEYQLTALQAQMNPHFIFNAINSVQRFILEKSKQEAYDYLAKFGKLIRMVLNNSEEKILTLQQELETLELYVELEQLRFSNSFEFKVTVAEDVNPYEVQIPALLIQPYIENAIWHGLMNLDKEIKGTLKMDISIVDDILKIVIEDNGVGRKRAKEYKQGSVHKPIAMKLTEQRLMMINQMKKYETAKVVVTDMEKGTRVEIFIPL